MKNKAVRFLVLAVLLLGPASFAQSTPFLGAGSMAGFNGIAYAGATSSCTVAVNAVNWAAGIATVNYVGSCGFGAGQSNVSLVGTGAPPAGFDTTNLTITATAAGQFSFAIAGPIPNFVGSATAGFTPLCGNLPNEASIASSTDVYIWSQNGNVGHQSLQGNDNRNPVFAPKNGQAWVMWQTTNPDNSNSAPTAICEYLGIDSVLGLELFFATNSVGVTDGAISFPGGCGAVPLGDNQVWLFPGDTALSLNACNAINGLPFNAAPTDVRAEDAAYQMARICGVYGMSGSGYGLSCGRSGGGVTTIASGINGSNKTVQPGDFNIGGPDPVSLAPHIAHSAAGADGHPWVSLNVGGQALLVIVNTADPSTNGFGSAALTNANRPDLGGIFTGGATRTRDLIQTPGLASKPLTALIREPIAGTYIAFENQVTRTDEFAHSLDQLTNNGGGFQMFGVGMAPCPTTGWAFLACPGALDQLDAKKTSTDGLKVRAIGAGEMVDCIVGNGCPSNQDQLGNTLSNQIGFAFFSFRNAQHFWQGSGGTGKYLTVDDADPLQANYQVNNGIPPACNTLTGCPGAVTLQNIVNGSYPLWNIFHVVTTGPLGAYAGTAQNPICLPGATVCQLVVGMQAYPSVVPDFVPINSMVAFRSHITLMAATPETGGFNFTAHNGYKHYGMGINGTPCGFAPVVGAAVNYECGRDAEGARILIERELDANTDFAIELTALLQ